MGTFPDLVPSNGLTVGLPLAIGLIQLRLVVTMGKPATPGPRPRTLCIQPPSFTTKFRTVDYRVPLLKTTWALGRARCNPGFKPPITNGFSAAALGS